MDFKTEKKGYNKSEVDAYIFNLVKNYEQSLARQNGLIEELKMKLDTSESKNKVYRDKESLVSKAITSAVAKADEIDRLAQLKYTREMQQLKAFHDKWLSYYDKILKKYPINDELISVGKFNDEMSRILEKARAQTNQAKAESDKSKETRIGYTVVDTDKDADGGESDDDDIFVRDFDPVDRIRQYLTKEHPKKPQTDEEQPEAEEEDAYGVATEKDEYTDRSPAGFSFEEALHPKDDLEDIMRDLGLIMDD
ncbi:MAG: hypothetical protein HFE48_00970 [Clostridia bacterium]|nr:hypothetical protein [Clostridia bacterium]